MEYRELVFYIINLFALLSLGGIAYFRKSLPKPFVWLALYLVSHLVIDIIANIAAKQGVNNLPLIHIYAYLEFVSLSLFYRGLIKKPNFQSPFFYAFILLGFLLMLGNSVFLQSFYEYNSYAKTFSNVSVTLYALIFIYNLFVGTIAPPFRQSFSTINFAFLIYFMGTLVIYLLSNYISKNNAEIMNDVWQITVYLNTFLMFMILIGTFQALNASRKNGAH